MLLQRLLEGQASLLVVASGGPFPPTVTIVSFGFEGPDFETLASEVRVVSTVPVVAAIVLDVPNPTVPPWLFLLGFWVLLERSCWIWV